MSGTRLRSSTRTRGLCSATRAAIASATAWALTKKRRPSGPQDQQPFEGLVVGMLRRQRAQDVGAALSADDVDDAGWRPGWRGRSATGRSRRRCPAGCRRRGRRAPRPRPMELHRAHPADRAELRRLDQPDRIDDDHGRQGRLGSRPRIGREQQHRRQRGRGGDERCHLRPPADGAHDRRSARFRRPPASRRAGRRRHWPRRSRPVRGWRRSEDRRRARRRARGDRLGEAHQGDAERARQQRADQRRSGSVSDGRPCGICPTIGDALRLEMEEPGGRDGARRPRPAAPANAASAAPADQHDHVRRRPRASTGCFRQVPDEAEDIGEEPSFWMCRPSSFGTWSRRITRPMPALNPVSTGRR